MGELTWEDKVIEFEDELIDSIDLKARIMKWNPEIREIFFDTFGENLERIDDLSENGISQMDMMLDRLEWLKRPEHQKVILAELGFVTGKPMTSAEVVDYFGIKGERVRAIEYRFFRKNGCCIHRNRRQKLLDFLKSE